MRSFTAFSAFISLAILLLWQTAYASPVLYGGPQSMATDASATQPATTNAERILRPLHTNTLLRLGKVNGAALQPEVVDNLSNADTLLRRGHVKSSAGTASASSDDDSEPAVIASSGKASNPPLQLSQADTLLRRDNVGSGPAITNPPLHLSNADTLLRRGNVETANSGPAVADDSEPDVADASEPAVADDSEPDVADASEPAVSEASAAASPTLHFFNTDTLLRRNLDPSIATASPTPLRLSNADTLLRRFHVKDKTGTSSASVVDAADEFAAPQTLRLANADTLL